MRLAKKGWEVECNDGNISSMDIKSGFAVDRAYYQANKMQAIELIQAGLTPEEFIGYCKGSVLKYNFRAKHKGNERIDIEKAEQYSIWQSQALRGETINPRQGNAR